MPTDPRPPFRRALLAVLTCLALAAAIGAQTFSERVHRVTAPEAASAGRFLGITRWGGRLFVLHEAACFWSSDGGATWSRQDFAADGPKGSVPGLIGAWFAAGAGGLWLNTRDRALAWRFEAGGWRAWVPGALVMAAAGWGDRLYALTPDHRLRLTRNSGDTWGEIPLPSAVKDGTFFDDLLVEGDHLVLRAEPVGNHAAAYSFDAGATWAFLAPRALGLLAHGRLYSFRDSLLIVYRDGADSFSRPALPTRAAYADSEGALFSLCDSGLFVADPAGIGPWTRVAGPEELRGWTEGRDVLYRREGGVLAWFDGLPERPDRLAPRGEPGVAASARYGFDPRWRAAPWFGSPGGARDPLGRRVRLAR